ncbi:MAG: hypothetical protein PVG45_03160 [Gammaproteobacteria bacterium]|jgi:hypothetical protein
MSKLCCHNDAVKRFVRSELGCSCPDEVFDNIHLLQHAAAFANADKVYDIGGRLLVALYLPEEWREIENQLEQLVESGRKYRDQHGYNRLRFVIATDDNKPAEILYGVFNSLSNVDAKVHLHVVKLQSLPADVFQLTVQ